MRQAGYAKRQLVGVQVFMLRLSVRANGQGF